MELPVSNSLRMMERSMDFLWTKQSAILDNISNAETPGYKTKYVTFEEALRNRLQSASGERKPVAAMREAMDQTSPTVHQAVGESTKMDENGVNVTEQSVELVRNAYQLQYAMMSINSDLSTLRTAIRGQ